MTKINPKSRRYRHKYLVMREMINKDVSRGYDTDWLTFTNWLAKWQSLPKYHGTKYRGTKRWLAKGNSIVKGTKGGKNGKQ